MEIIDHFLNQMIFTIGVIAAFGVLIALCRKAFCKIVGDNGPKILLATGIVGTPIHELSHATMCVLFAHKIVGMKLYQPNSEDGTLGYVQHTYNRKNPYAVIGNFFIGIAPILGGSAVILLLMWLLVPDVFYDATSELAFLDLLTFDLTDPSTYLGYLDLFWDEVQIIFGFVNMGSIWWWIFFLLAFMVANHMELSWADIKGGWSGFLLIAVVLLIADVIMYFIAMSALEAVTGAMISFSVTIIGFLAIAAVFSGVMVVIALMLKGLKKGVKKL